MQAFGGWSQGVRRVEAAAEHSLRTPLCVWCGGWRQDARASTLRTPLFLLLFFF